jgi:hypothetical protein
MPKSIFKFLTFSSILMFSTVSYADSANYIKKDGYFGCKSLEYREKLGMLVAQGDRETFAKGLYSGVAAGVCVLFDPGDKVYIVDTKVFSGLVKVRPQGDMDGYWTNLEAVN